MITPYDVAVLVGYYFIFIICSIIAIVIARSNASWIIFGIGAVIQFLSILGNSKSGNNSTLYWALYGFILLITIIIIAIRQANAKNKAEEEIKEENKNPNNEEEN